METPTIRLSTTTLCSLITVLLVAACSTTPSRPIPPSVDTRMADPDAPDGAIYAPPMPSAALDLSITPRRIVFASCAHQNRDQSIWNRIAAENPDLVLLLGDNVYGDTHSDDPSLPELKAAYMRLAASEPFARLRASTPLLTVWDDHDYGLNDAGSDFRHRKASEALFHHVWAIPDDDPRRNRPGIYGSWILGDTEGERVQIILLDTRSFRSPLRPTDEVDAPGKERYLPDPDPGKTMLGEAQWRWLESELSKPADLRLLVSSIQVIAEGHGWEAWRTLPSEREKLYRLLADSGADHLILLSGDRHSAGLYQRDDVLPYPLFEATSSSLNLSLAGMASDEEEESDGEPGPHRLGDLYPHVNYGLIEIDWRARTVGVSIRNPQGIPVLSRTLDLNQLARIAGKPGGAIGGTPPLRDGRQSSR